MTFRQTSMLLFGIQRQCNIKVKLFLKQLTKSKFSFSQIITFGPRARTGLLMFLGPKG